MPQLEHVLTIGVCGGSIAVMYRLFPGYTQRHAADRLTSMDSAYIIIKTYQEAIPQRRRMAKASRQQANRQQALQAQGAANPHPDTVADALFRGGGAFFDPNDLVQVKYEMLRSVEKDGRAVVEAVEAFGFSRPVYYVTRELFDREGLPGLLPRKRGPKSPHKLKEEHLAVLAQAVRDAERMPSGAELAALLADRCGVSAHPRSILRRLLPYLKEPEKKLR